MFQFFKKLVIVSTISILVTKANKKVNLAKTFVVLILSFTINKFALLLKFVLYIYYLILFKKIFRLIFKL